MHNRAAIAAIAPRSRSSRRDRGAIANKFLQGMPLIRSLFAAFCLLQIERTVLFVANSQWNTLNTVCSGATRL